MIPSPVLKVELQGASPHSRGPRRRPTTARRGLVIGARGTDGAAVGLRLRPVPGIAGRPGVPRRPLAGPHKFGERADYRRPLPCHHPARLPVPSTASTPPSRVMPTAAAVSSALSARAESRGIAFPGDVRGINHGGNASFRVADRSRVTFATCCYAPDDVSVRHYPTGRTQRR